MKVYHRIDDILKFLKTRPGSSIGHYIMDGDGEEGKKLIIEHGLVTFKSSDHKRSVAYITASGENVLEVGGFEKWIAPRKLKEDFRENLELQKLVGDVQKLQLDIDFAKGAKSRSNLSIVVAIISALISLVALILSLSKWWT